MFLTCKNVLKMQKKFFFNLAELSSESKGIIYTCKMYFYTCKIYSPGLIVTLTLRV